MSRRGESTIAGNPNGDSAGPERGLYARVVQSASGGDAHACAALCALSSSASAQALTDVISPCASGGAGSFARAAIWRALFPSRWSPVCSFSVSAQSARPSASAPAMLLVSIVTAMSSRLAPSITRVSRLAAVTAVKRCSDARRGFAARSPRRTEPFARSSPEVRERRSPCPGSGSVRRDRGCGRALAALEMLPNGHCLNRSPGEELVARCVVDHTCCSHGLGIGLAATGHEGGARAGSFSE